MSHPTPIWTHLRPAGILVVYNAIPESIGARGCIWLGTWEFRAGQKILMETFPQWNTGNRQHQFFCGGKTMTIWTTFSHSFLEKFYTKCFVSTGHLRIIHAAKFFSILTLVPFQGKTRCWNVRVSDWYVSKRVYINLLTPFCYLNTILIAVDYMCFYFCTAKSHLELKCPGDLRRNPGT